MGTILIILLVLLLLGALPTWPYSGSWGYYPSGGPGTGFADRGDPGAYGQSLSGAYFSLSLEWVSIRRFVKMTSARICVHSETMFPATCPHFESGSACL